MLTPEQIEMAVELAKLNNFEAIRPILSNVSKLQLMKLVIEQQRLIEKLQKQKADEAQTGVATSAKISKEHANV